MNERFVERMRDAEVRGDTRIVAGLAAIYCRRRHAGQPRARLASDAAELGAYGRRPPLLCEECAEHIRYAEKRRAYCPKDPKPFCAHCDTHCYKPDEAEWQRQMMRFAGPRSMFSRHAIPAVRHAMEARKWRKHLAGTATTTTAAEAAETREN